MAQLKAQLEAAGYDTAGLDETAILGQLDAAGYDTSSLGQTASQPQTPADSAPSAAPESKTRQFTRKVANALPLVGGIGAPVVGAIASGGLSLPATAGLAAAGGAAGEGVKQAILSALGDQAPTLGEVTGRVAKTAAIEGGTTLVGGKLFKGAAAGGRLAKDLITKPGAAEVALAGKEALVDIAERGGEKLALARTTREAAKKGLIEAEEKAGLHFESTPGFEDYIKDPKKMSDFATKIGRLAKQKPEEIAQAIDSKTLQLFRKIAQEGEKVSTLSDIAKSQLRQGKDIVTQALGQAEKGIGEQLGRFREADKVVGEIPSQIKELLTKKKLQSARDVLGAKKLDVKRKVLKSLGYAGAGVLGAKHVLNSVFK